MLVLLVLLLAASATAVAAKAFDQSKTIAAPSAPHAPRPAILSANTAAAAPPAATPSATPTPSVTPAAQPSTKPSATPTPNVVPMSTAAKPGAPVVGPGVTPRPATNPLVITAASASQANIICQPGQIYVEFFHIMLTANSGNSGGNAVAYIEFPDGSRTDDQIVPFSPMTPGSSSQLSEADRYLAYQLSPGATAADIVYRIRVVSPNTYTTNWIGLPLNYWCPGFAF